MDGVAKPDLIIKPGASPHGYSLRPSEARALERADVVFWVSEDLTPWLEGPLENLAGSANKIELSMSGYRMLRESTKVRQYKYNSTTTAWGSHRKGASRQASPFLSERPT